MSKDSKSIRSKVDTIAGEIAADRVGRSNSWDGADVVITDMPPNLMENPSFYPAKRKVVTSFVRELNWLFVSLGDVFGTAVDFHSKPAFYGQLADAADRYLTSNSRDSHTAKGLLTAVTIEAGLMAEELK